MEQSFENENTCDVFMNEIRMENELCKNLKRLQVSKQEEAKIQKIMKRK
jgi:hypothetical protein